MTQYHVTYRYLATGMEGRPDERDYGVIEAESAEAAKMGIAQRVAESLRDQQFVASCLRAEPVAA